MQQNLSLTKSLEYLNVSKALCIIPNFFGYCPGTKCKFLLGALPMCVSTHRILPLHTFLWMPLRWAAGTQGGVQVTVPLPMWRW